jgi:hypothetical protein
MATDRTCSPRSPTRSATAPERRPGNISPVSRTSSGADSAASDRGVPIRTGSQGRCQAIAVAGDGLPADTGPRLATRVRPSRVLYLLIPLCRETAHLLAIHADSRATIYPQCVARHVARVARTQIPDG